MAWKLRYTGLDLIGCRLGIGNDGLLIKVECFQSRETTLLIIGQPTKNPTPLLMSSMMSFISCTPMITNLCDEHENKLLIEFMADRQSKEHNKLFIESSHQLK